MRPKPHHLVVSPLGIKDDVQSGSYFPVAEQNEFVNAKYRFPLAFEIKHSRVCLDRPIRLGEPVVHYPETLEHRLSWLENFVSTGAGGKGEQLRVNLHLAQVAHHQR